MRHALYGAGREKTLSRCDIPTLPERGMDEPPDNARSKDAKAKAKQ